MIRKRPVGLLVTTFRQKDEDYMDDVQFVSEELQDVVTFNTPFGQFEALSGCWLSKALCTLKQCVVVAQTFALSKLWYVSQVLLLPHAFPKKIDAALSSFIFRGRHKRLKLAELQNSEEKGSLSLTCVATKAECLLLRQSLRILSRPEETSYQHLGYWLGLFLQETFPGLIRQGPVSQALLPRFPLHQAMLVVIQEGLLRKEFDPEKPESATTKIKTNDAERRSSFFNQI